MQIVRPISLLLGFIATAILTLPSAAQSTPTPQLQQMFANQESAWNRGDGTAWAADFSNDADFVNIRGDLFHGQGEIAQRHNSIFNGPFKGSHLTITIRQSTEIAPGVALIETIQEVTGFKALPPGITATSEGVLKTRMKYVAVKTGDDWHFVAAQNTAILPAASMPMK